MYAYKKNNKFDLTLGFIDDSCIKKNNFADFEKEGYTIEKISKSEIELLHKPTLEELKKAKILEAKAKREEKLSNFVVNEGVIEARRKAETLLILKEYKEMLDQNINLAEFGLKDDKLIKLTKPIIDKWLLAISKQYNQAWLDYRVVKKKINSAKTMSTLNKIIIK